MYSFDAWIRKNLQSDLKMLCNFVLLLLLLRPMQCRIQLSLNTLVTIQFYFQVNSILETNRNRLCSLFKIKLLIFGPKKFVISRILHFQVDSLSKRGKANLYFGFRLGVQVRFD